MKRTITFILITLTIIFSALSKDFSGAEKSIINKTLQARLNTRLYEACDDAIKSLNDFKSKIEADSEYTSAGEEAKFIVQNMLVLEIYNYMYQKDMNSKELKPYILAQYNQIESFQKAHQSEELSSWFYLSSGDVINSSMQFIPQATAIKLGLQEKTDYDSVVSKDPELAFGRINRALWYYFAPAIGGGSKSVAKADFEKAVEVAATSYEKFYSRIYLSQVYYDEGNTADCKRLLDECDKILPSNVYTPFIRFLNDNKYSLLFYTNNRDKVEKKLGL